MSESTPIPEHLVKDLIVHATIQSMSAAAESLIIAFEGCDDNGFPLTQVQKKEIMQCVMFVQRNYEKEVTSHFEFLKILAVQFSDTNPPQGLREMTAWLEENKKEEEES